MSSCTLSNEEKAEKLVKETLKDYLYQLDSYEPISTRVDSMFIDVATIAPIMEISDEIKDWISKINSCERKIESAESSMDIWALDDYSSQVSRGEYSFFSAVCFRYSTSILAHCLSHCKGTIFC